MRPAHDLPDRRWPVGSHDVVSPAPVVRAARFARRRGQSRKTTRQMHLSSPCSPSQKNQYPDRPLVARPHAACAEYSPGNGLTGRGSAGRVRFRVSAMGHHTERRLPARCGHSFLADLVPLQRRAAAGCGAYPRRPSLRSGFPAVLGPAAPPPNSLRSLRSLRSNTCGESEVDPRCARGPRALCSSAPPMRATASPSPPLQLP